MNIAWDDPAHTMRQAFDLARVGELHRASELCSAVLRQNAGHAEAWLLRAVIAAQAGNWAEGAAAARRSIQSDATRAAAHALLGDALLKMAQPRDALASYEAALQRNGNLTSAHFGRGRALLVLRRPSEAVASYEEVLRLQPDDAEALCDRGNALFELGEWQDAVASYNRVIALRPTHAAALNNRGCALLSLRNVEAALASFDAALAIEPAFAEALYYRAAALKLANKPQDALHSLDRALRAKPGYVEALVLRGEVLRELQRPSEALAGFEHALQLRPDSATALRGRGEVLLDLRRPQEALAALDAAMRHGAKASETLNSRGNALRALGRYTESVSAYEQSLALEPDNAGVHCNLAHALMQCDSRVEAALASYCRALALDPDSAYAAGSLHHAQSSRADWSGRSPAAAPANIVSSVLAGKPVCAAFAFLSITDSAAAQLACAAAFAKRHAGTDTPRLRSKRHRHERIRIAYVSADFREHAVTYLMSGVLERHDRRRFETYGVSLRPPEATMAGKRIASAVDRFIDASESSDEEIAAQMQSLEIDIAIDLTGYTQGCRPQIFARGAAPIQVNYLGYPGTMSAPFMDYLIADDFVIPPEKRRYYSESVVYLPDCFQANDDRRARSRRSFSRSGQGLPERGFVFCCLNNSHKINPPMFDIWMRLLERVPGSVLWLLGHAPEVHGNLRREASSRGVAADRLVFAERVDYADHLSRLALADLFLDTLPFNAGTTASDALWAGLPVLTRAGEAFAARMAGSLLRAARIPELVTFSAQEYADKAVELALSPARLHAVRRSLAEGRATLPLFDTDRFTRLLEAAYSEMWQRHESGRAPSGFAV